MIGNITIFDCTFREAGYQTRLKTMLIQNLIKYNKSTAAVL
ncbi:hypothetical protein [uncultured Brachyspira sp.]|nr:hypothetical protein [uncultured Brachyspira sp.]